MKLNVQNILCCPLLTKTLDFCAMAERTGSLCRTSFSFRNTIKDVASFAMRLSGINSRYRGTVLETVISDGNCLYVRGINAGAISTFVVDYQTVFQITKVKKPCNSVRAPSSAPEVESPIAIFIKRHLPDVAIATLLPLAIEADQFFLSAVHLISKYWTQRRNWHSAGWQANSWVIV